MCEVMIFSLMNSLGRFEESSFLSFTPPFAVVSLNSLETPTNFN